MPIAISARRYEQLDPFNQVGIVAEEALNLFIDNFG